MFYNRARPGAPLQESVSEKAKASVIYCCPVGNHLSAGRFGFIPFPWTLRWGRAPLRERAGLSMGKRGCYHGFVTSKLVLATSNPHKVRELRRLLACAGWDLVTPADLGLEMDVAEDGASFRENATLKAVAYAQACGLPALADDSGIEVQALAGGPGVYSARFGGPGLGDRDRMLLLLDRMQGVPWERRGSRYVCVVVLAWPGGRREAFEGVCHGVVALEPGGTGGFGYDPLFYFPEAGKTIAQMSEQEKDEVSHRGHAVRRAVKGLKGLDPLPASGNR